MTVETNIGNITGDKETLNNLVMLLHEAGNSYDRTSFVSMGEEAHKTASLIFDALYETGYYDFD